MHLTVERLVEEGYQIVRLPLPALITVVKEIAPPRLPTLEGKMRARRAASAPMTLTFPPRSWGLPVLRPGWFGSRLPRSPVPGRRWMPGTTQRSSRRR